MIYSPKRVQRKRTRGWRTPLCGCGCGKPAIYVGRPTRWGNPYKSSNYRNGLAVLDERGYGTKPVPAHLARETAVRLYDIAFTYAVGMRELRERALTELRGHDLMCWCPLDQPCHADVLLEIANQEQGEQQ